ncbi:MAG TPA: OB-fold domain-containing protein [Acidimicrobiales bacterium]|jgi:uncharacterized OB-fold protein
MTRQIPVLDGWWSGGDDPALLGHRCTTCQTITFPFRRITCPNPECEGDEFDTVELSRVGTIWSYTDARYQPPPPYVGVGQDDFVPFAQAAVELGPEALVILGQVAAGYTVDQLEVGMKVELVVEPLYVDDASGDERTTYRWRPVGIEAATEAPPLPRLAADPAATAAPAGTSGP